MLKIGHAVTRPGRILGDEAVTINVPEELETVPGIVQKPQEVDFYSREDPLGSLAVDNTADRDWLFSVVADEQRLEFKLNYAMNVPIIKESLESGEVEPTAEAEPGKDITAEIKRKARELGFGEVGLRAKTPVGDTREGTTGHSANLLVWWHTEFTPEEQSYILARYKPMVMGGAGDSNLDRIIRPDGSLGLISSLAVLSTWFLSEDDIPLARRILAKSVERQESETGSFVDRHFIYGHMLKVYYRDRNRDGNALALAIQTCEKQIAIAPQVIREMAKESMWDRIPAHQRSGYTQRAIREMKKEIMWDGHLPAHGGYTQLAIILERNKDYEGAIRLSQEALRQGWAGDWEKRMARCKQRSNR